MGGKYMILVSVHTLFARAEIYVDGHQIKAFDVAFLDSPKMDAASIRAIIEDIYTSNFLSPMAKKSTYREFPAVLLKMDRPELASIALSHKYVTRLLTGV